MRARIGNALPKCVKHWLTQQFFNENETKLIHVNLLNRILQNHMVGYKTS